MRSSIRSAQSQDNANISASTLKRIYKDIEELKRKPQPGISLCMPNSKNPLTLHANIVIMQGIYKDLLLHLIIHLPPNYPLMAPAANIARGLNFGPKHHHHVYDNAENGNDICLDLLTNLRFMYDGSRFDQSGWTSSYTLLALLIQLQVFFSDPDFGGVRPNKDDVKDLFKHAKDFRLNIELDDGQIVEHNYQKPYPPFEYAEEKIEEDEICTTKDSIQKEKQMKDAEDILLCSISKCSLFDESKPILGYPLDIKRDRHNKFWTTPINEFISYETFLALTNNESEREETKARGFKSSFGDLFNFWIPIYINETHWNRSFDKVQAAIATISTGKTGCEFKPYMICHALPAILHTIVVKMARGDLCRASVALQAYCYFYRLAIKLLDEYPSLREKLNREIESAINNEFSRGRLKQSNMGEFLIKLALSDYGVTNIFINALVLEEYLARQVGQVVIHDKRLTQRQSCSNFAKRFLSAATDQVKILAIAFETARLMSEEISIEELDNNYGLLPRSISDGFSEKLHHINKRLTDSYDWKVLPDCLRLHEQFKSEEDMVQILDTAFDVSFRQGYTVLYEKSRPESVAIGSRRQYSRIYVPKDQAHIIL